MDFAKLKDGVLALSSFLVGHAAWLAATIYCIWVAIGPDRAHSLLQVTYASLTELESGKLKTLLDAYALRPLIAPLVFFAGIFLLHAHRETLKSTGRYIPPEIVWHYMPGLRDISVGRWQDVLAQLRDSISFATLRSILEARYRREVETQRIDDYASAFNIFKALALVNICLGLWPSNVQRATSFLLALCFLVAAAITALLHIYHSWNASRWALENVFRQLVVDEANNKAERHPDDRHELSDQDRRHIADIVGANGETPIASLSWYVPLVGNLRILKESIARVRSDVQGAADRNIR